MIVIEFFCGENKSFSKEAEARGHETFTIDNNPKTNPDLCIDIMDLTLEMIPEKYRHPDVFWASLPCIQYSHAKRTGVRDIEGANKLVKKTLEWRDILKPEIWIMENPQTGLLKKQPILNTIFYQMPYTDVSYCKYGLPYRKQTRLWTNLKFIGKICKKDCKFMNGKKHIGSAGNGRKEYTDKNYRQAEKHQVPNELCLELVKCCEKKCVKSVYCEQPKVKSELPSESILMKGGEAKNNGKNKQ